MIRRLLACSPLMVAAIATANDADDRLRAASESQRRLAFARILAASGERCGEVIDTYRQGLTRNDEAIWSVRCSNGRAIVIVVLPDAGGSTRILECSTFLRQTGRACFTKF